MFRKFGYCVVVVIMLMAGSTAAQDDTTRVLFIGNSHTYVNDVPHLFAGLAASGGHPAVTDMSAPGGYTLLQHTTNPTTLAKISQGGWDFVSLQEQSLYPVIDYYRFESFYPSARLLDSLITHYGGRTVLYMTWGRPNGGLWSIGGHYTIDFVDFFQMQDSVSASFRMLSNELSSPLVPTGDAWARALHADTTIVLWQSDNLHATLNGSYLAACAFYAILFQESPVGLTFTGGLSPQVALFLQRMVDETVTSIEDDPSPLPGRLGIFQNYPNPFNSGTTLMFDLPHSGFIELTIYDILGKRVRALAEDKYPEGRHLVAWNGRNELGESSASGVYLGVLNNGADKRSIRLFLIR